MAYDPAIKMLLNLKLNQLIYKAMELKLDHTGTKLDLAVRIAKFQEEEMSRVWQSISGP